MKLVPFIDNQWGICRYRKNAKAGEPLLEYYVFGSDEPVWVNMHSPLFEEWCLTTKGNAEETLRKLQDK